MAIYDKRWMLFVDGENFTIQAQGIAKEKGLPIEKHQRFMKDTYFWMGAEFWKFYEGHCGKIWLFGQKPIRQYYYTTVVGDSIKLKNIQKTIRGWQFEPVLFKKQEQKTKTKAVDITLATHMLSHAFRDNYDVAVLVAGDGDYVPLVEEIKRAGKIVWLFFFDKPYGLNENLYLACDMYKPMTNWLIKTLTKLNEKQD